MILSICDSPNVLEIMNIVVTIIKVIITVVPIILLFSLIFKAVSAATQGKEDALAELKKKAVPNIVSAVLIFLIPTLVSLIVTVSFPESDYTKCISGISRESIQEAYEDKAEKLVRTAEETLNINDYSAAMNYMPNVQDDDKRESYEKRLEEVKRLIDEKRAEMFLAKYDKVNYSSFKWTYYKSNNGPIMNYTSKTTNPYAIWAPDNPSDLNGVSLPLMIWLHGSGEKTSNGVGERGFLGSGLLKVMNDWNKYNLQPVPAIIVAPQTADGWGTTVNYNTIDALIKYVENTYNTDSTKKVVIGHSMGGYGTIVVAYKFRDLGFYAAVPMSTDKTEAYGEDGRKYYSSIKMMGYGEYSDQGKFFKWIGQPDNFHFYKGEVHGKVPQRALTEDLDGNGISDLIEYLFYEE